MYFLELFNSSVWTAAIIGGIGGLIGVLAINKRKTNRMNSIWKSVNVPDVSYFGNYHYASFKRFSKSFKFFDSFGVLYVAGDKLYYKTAEGVPPMEFNLKECTVQLEKDWRFLKWFSVTTPSGEKYYFNSHKMGALKSDSAETLKGYEAIRAKSAAAA